MPFQGQRGAVHKVHKQIRFEREKPVALRGWTSFAFGPVEPMFEGRYRCLKRLRVQATLLNPWPCAFLPEPLEPLHISVESSPGLCQIIHLSGVAELI